MGGGGAGWGGKRPDNGDWVPLTEVEVPYMWLGEPGPETRDVGGREEVDPRPKDEENWLEREARVFECPGGKRPDGVRL